MGVNPADSRDELRAALERLVESYSGADNADWMDGVPYLVRTTVVDDLRAALAATPAPTASLDAAVLERAIAVVDGTADEALSAGMLLIEYGDYREWAKAIAAEYFHLHNEEPGQ